MSKRHHPMVLSASDKLNQLSEEDIGKLWATISKNSVTLNGCLIPNPGRKQSVGNYPTAQIPYAIASKYDNLKEFCNEKDKGKLKVCFHQIAWRYAGNLLPDRSEDEVFDLAHSCQNGKFLQSGGGCFECTHLSASSHKDNMDSQRCIMFARCEHCQLLNYVCRHEPRCVNNELEEQKYCEDRRVVEVTVKYSDGSIEVTRNGPLSTDTQEEEEDL